MARVMHRLTARTVETTVDTGRHADGGGLYLFVSPGGRRRWVFRYARAGRVVEMGLGGAGRGAVSLAKAREQAAAMRAALGKGDDPLAARRSSAAARDAIPGFGAVADAYVELMRPSWRSGKHADQWAMTLGRHAAPIRDLPIDRVDTDAVLAVLIPLWQRTPETAERLRGRIEAVLDHGKAKGLRSGENPARWRGHLDQMLPKRQRLSRGHHSAIAYDEVPVFVAALRLREAPAARLLEFTILTAARTGEALRARWSEVDLDKAIWTVPASRMKSGREHRVPLAQQTLAILTDRPRGGDDAFVFAGSHGRPLSNMAMLTLLKRMGRSDITVHGFRSAFRDWAAETTAFPHEVCEMALAHTIGNKAEAAYRRGDLFEKRRQLMAGWGRYAIAEHREQNGAASES